MRLINASTLELEEFLDDRVAPKYAILSHRWEEDEVSFKDVMKGRAKGKKGYRKIELCCKQAIEDGLTHVWVDTCCIDKKSSAELSEAINSMYRWYKDAQVCYAYLSDVTINAGNFEQSVWFTRGWTLQELIAPKRVIFYDALWMRLGSKTDFARSISQATMIPKSLLLQQSSKEDYSIAQKMSWASRRTTTRIEDTAYSLIGLFGINMPMLYGEGQKAFERLQEEIIKRSFDDSILTWDRSGTRPVRTLLAPSPSEFADCADVVWASSSAVDEYTMANLGLRITLTLIPWSLDIYLCLLKCFKRFKRMQDLGMGTLRIGIFLRSEPLAREKYAGVDCNGRQGEHVVSSASTMPMPFTLQAGTSVVYVPQEKLGSALVELRIIPSITLEELRKSFRRQILIKPNPFLSLTHNYGIYLFVDNETHLLTRGMEIFSWTPRSSSDGFLRTPDAFRRTAGVVLLPSSIVPGRRGDQAFLLKLGLDLYFQPVLLFSRSLWGCKYWNLAPRVDETKDTRVILRSDWIEYVTELKYENVTAQQEWENRGYFIVRTFSEDFRSLWSTLSIKIDFLAISVQILRRGRAGWNVHVSQLD